MSLGALELQSKSQRVRQVYSAAQRAALTGSVMVGAIGLGKAGLVGFLWIFLSALAVSTILICALLILVLFPLITRRSHLDALAVGLWSMVVLPAFVYVGLNAIFGLFPPLTSPVVMLPLIAASVYGVLIGGHLKRLESGCKLGNDVEVATQSV